MQIIQSMLITTMKSVIKLFSQHPSWQYLFYQTNFPRVCSSFLLLFSRRKCILPNWYHPPSNILLCVLFLRRYNVRFGPLVMSSSICHFCLLVTPLGYSHLCCCLHLYILVCYSWFFFLGREKVNLLHCHDVIWKWPIKVRNMKPLTL